MNEIVNRLLLAGDKFMMKHLILLRIENMRDISVDLLQCSITFLIKKLLAAVFKMRNKLLAEELRKEKYTRLL